MVVTFTSVNCYSFGVDIKGSAFSFVYWDLYWCSNNWVLWRRNIRNFRCLFYSPRSLYIECITRSRPCFGHFVLGVDRSEEHTSELQSRPHLVCRRLIEKKNTTLLSQHSIVHIFPH